MAWQSRHTVTMTLLVTTSQGDGTSHLPHAGGASFFKFAEAKLLRIQSVVRMKRGRRSPDLPLWTARCERGLKPLQLPRGCFRGGFAAHTCIFKVEEAKLLRVDASPWKKLETLRLPDYPGRNSKRCVFLIFHPSLRATARARAPECR